MLSHLKSRSDSGLWLWTAIIAAVYAATFGSFPLMIDNWLFESFYIEANGGDSTFDLGAWVRYMQHEFEYDNGRMAQMVAPLISLNIGLLRWPVALLLGMGMAVISVFTARLMCGRLTTASLLLSWLCLTLVLPWRNWMAGELYAMNYIPPCACALWALYLMRSGSFRLRHMLPALLLCTWGHECIGLAMSCGMTGYIILQGFRADRRWWIATAVLLAATLFFILGAGMLHRIDNQVATDFSLNHMLLVGRVHYVFILLAAIYLLCLANSRRRRAALNLLADPVFAVASASALTLLVINTFNGCQSRFGFMPQLTSLIAIGILLRRCFGTQAPQWKAPLCLLCGSLLLVFWSLVAYYQWHCYAEYCRMQSLMQQHCSGKIVMEFEYLDTPRPWLLNIPMRNLINNEYDIYCLSRRYPQIDRFTVTIVRPDGSQYEHI